MLAMLQSRLGIDIMRTMRRSDIDRIDPMEEIFQIIAGKGQLMLLHK